MSAVGGSLSADVAGLSAVQAEVLELRAQVAQLNSCEFLGWYVAVEVKDSLTREERLCNQPIDLESRTCTLPALTSVKVGHYSGSESKASYQCIWKRRIAPAWSPWLLQMLASSA